MCIFLCDVILQATPSSKAQKSHSDVHVSHTRQAMVQTLRVACTHCQPPAVCHVIPHDQNHVTLQTTIPINWRNDFESVDAAARLSSMAAASAASTLIHQRRPRLAKTGSRLLVLQSASPSMVYGMVSQLIRVLVIDDIIQECTQAIIVTNLLWWQATQFV